MRYQFKSEEARKIEELVACAITASTKSEAKKYADKLNYIGTDVMGYSRNVYLELVASVCSASGAVREKERLVDIVQQLLCKFQMNCVESET